MASRERWACTWPRICTHSDSTTSPSPSRPRPRPRARTRPRSPPPRSSKSSNHHHHRSLAATTTTTLLLLSLLLTPLTTATCYDSTGQLVTIADYLPCRDTSNQNNNDNNNNENVNAKTPMCCASNRPLGPGANPPGSKNFTRDVCMANGLCRNVWRNGSGVVVVTYYRDFCDNEAGAGCLGDMGVGEGSRFLSADKTVQVTPCDSDKTGNTTRWCLGGVNAACCLRWDTHSEAVTIPLALGGSLSSTESSSSSSPTSVPSSATSSPGPTANNPSSSSSSSLSAGIIAGIAIAVSAGILLILLTDFYMRNKSRQRHGQRLLPASATNATSAGGAGTSSSDHKWYSEIGDTSDGMGIEMGTRANYHQPDGKARPFELGDSPDGLMPVELGNGRSTRAGSRSSKLEIRDERWRMGGG